MFRSNNYRIPLLAVLYLLTLIGFFSCENDGAVEPVEQQVFFEITSPTQGSGRVADEPVITQIVVSIATASGESVLEDEEINVSLFGSGYLSDPISLETGDYQLTKFLVLSEAVVVYASPLEDAELAYLVDDPLPINFVVSEDEVSTVQPEVLHVSEGSIVAFGYSEIAFDLIQTFDLLVSVLAYDETTEGYELTEASIAIAADGEELLSQELFSTTNKLVLPDGSTTYQMNVSKEGYDTYSQEFTADSLKNYQGTSMEGPLEIILVENDLTSGLIAYFPLDGNADDLSGNDFDGLVSGATLTNGLDDQANTAYDLDGVDDHINFGDVADLGTRDYTISLWTRVGTFKGPLEGTGSAGAWMIAKGITIAGTPQRAGFALKAQKIDDQNHFLFLTGDEPSGLFSVRKADNYQEDTWYHVVGRRVADKMELYIDGELVASSTIPVGMDTNTNIPLSLGRIDKLGFDPAGTTYFDGAIDEVRIYDRALRAEEITKLSEIINL